MTVHDAGARRRPIPTRLCKVDGCGSDLGNEKLFYRRGRCCSEHAMLLTVRISNALHRFCQKCCAFHSDLSAFDGSKKSCRRRLAEHNARRQNDNRTSTSARRAASAAAAATAAAYATSTSSLRRKPSASALLADAATGPAIEASAGKGRGMTPEEFALFEEFGGRSGRPQRACKAAAVKALAAAAEADCSSSGGGGVSEGFKASDSINGLSDTAGSGAASPDNGTATAASMPAMPVIKAESGQPEYYSLDSAPNSKDPGPPSAQYMLCDSMLEVPTTVDMDQGNGTTAHAGSGQTHADSGLLQDGTQSMPLLWCDSVAGMGILNDDTFEPMAPNSACTVATPMTISFGDGSSASSGAVLHIGGTELGTSVAAWSRDASSSAMHVDASMQWLPGAGAPLSATNSDPLLSSYSSGWVGSTVGVPIANLSSGGSSGNARCNNTLSNVPDIQMTQQPAGKHPMQMAVRAQPRAISRRSSHSGNSALRPHPVWRSDSADLLPATAPAALMSGSPAAELQSLLPAGVEWDCHQAMQVDFPRCVAHQQAGTGWPPWFDDTALEQLQPPTSNAAKEPPLWQVWQEQQRIWQETAATNCDVTRHGQPQGRILSSSPGLPAIPSWSDIAAFDSLDASASYPTDHHDYPLLVPPGQHARTQSPLSCSTQQVHNGVLRGHAQASACVLPMPLLPPSLQRRLQAHREQQYVLSFGHLPNQPQSERKSQVSEAAAASGWFPPGPFLPPY